MNAKKQSEKYIEPILVKAVAAAGGQAVKMALLGERGFPDRLCIFPGGRVAFVEVKGTGLDLSPRQRLWRRTLLSLGQEYHLIDHTDKITDLICP